MRETYFVQIFLSKEDRSILISKNNLYGNEIWKFIVGLVKIFIHIYFAIFGSLLSIILKNREENWWKIRIWKFAFRNETKWTRLRLILVECYVSLTRVRLELNLIAVPFYSFIGAIKIRWCRRGSNRQWNHPCQKYQYYNIYLKCPISGEFKLIFKQSFALFLFNFLIRKLENFNIYNIYKCNTYLPIE